MHHFFQLWANFRLEKLNLISQTSTLIQNLAKLKIVQKFRFCFENQTWTSILSAQRPKRLDSGSFPCGKTVVFSKLKFPNSSLSKRTFWSWSSKFSKNLRFLAKLVEVDQSLSFREKWCIWLLRIILISAAYPEQSNAPFFSTLSQFSFGKT